MLRHAGDHLDGPWLEVLDQLTEAVIVIDEQRQLRHANTAARRLLGVDQGQAIGGRCRLLTHGLDCDGACPLTYALETGLERVESFATAYRTAAGDQLALEVTVVPLLGADGAFRGAVEILRPSGPRPGFFACGRSERAAELRRRLAAAAASGRDLVVVGEAPACRDVARAVHRHSGLPEALLRPWRGGWDEVVPWPPGTVYADGAEAHQALATPRPEGWRVVCGARSADGWPASCEVLRLPELASLAEDLPRMIAAWVDELEPGRRVTAAALGRLAEVAAARGLAALEGVLATALAAADGVVDLPDLPVDGARLLLVDELLRAERPLAALEERVLREVIELCGWRMQEAADRLGISRVTLWRKMKDLGIDRP
ncbi:MAG: PAS domain-containing protein [Thermoanaerobaculales bacterium]|nr:PAS domain-containing protein [Thermoanaerobaculales bacterium]